MGFQAEKSINFPSRAGEPLLAIQCSSSCEYPGQHNGQAIIGFQQGARTYFNKVFGALSEVEYLSLVATIIAPNELNVATNPAKNHERVNRIKRLLSGACRPLDLADVYYQQCGGGL